MHPRYNPLAIRRHPLLGTWKAMRRRCESPKHRSFPRYGGRGIKVCERWQDLRNFIEDMGPRPTPKHTLDRIDNDGDYAPGNVRWATQAEQLRNQVRNRLLTFAGRTQCLTDWCAELGIAKHVLAARLNALGWSVERALSTPVRAFRRYRA